MSKEKKGKSSSSKTSISSSSPPSPDVRIINQVSLEDRLAANAKNAIDLTNPDCNVLVNELEELAKNVKQHSTNLPTSESVEIIRQIKMKIDEAKILTSSFTRSAQSSYQGTFVDDVFDDQHTIKEPKLLFGAAIIRLLNQIGPGFILSLGALYTAEDIALDVFHRLSFRARELVAIKSGKEDMATPSSKSGRNEDLVIVHEKQAINTLFLIFDKETDEYSDPKGRLWWKSEKAVQELIPEALKKWKALSKKNRLAKFNSQLAFFRKVYKEFHPDGISARHVQEAYRLVSTGELKKHGVNEGARAVVKTSVRKGSACLTKSCGLTINVDLVGKIFVGATGCVVASEAAVSLAATIEYVLAEVLELSKNHAESGGRRLIRARDMMMAMHNDAEVHHFTRDTCVLEGGATPSVHSFKVCKVDPFPESSVARKDQDGATQELVVPRVSYEGNLDDLQNQFEWSHFDPKLFEECFGDPHDLEGLITNFKKKKEKSEPPRKKAKEASRENEHERCFSLGVSRKLAARAGITHMSILATDQLCSLLSKFLEDVIESACFVASESDEDAVFSSAIERALVSSGWKHQSSLKLLGTGRNHLIFMDPHPHQVANFGEDHLASDQEFQIMKAKLEGKIAVYLVEKNEEEGAKRIKIENILKEDLNKDREEKKIFLEEENNIVLNNEKLIKELSLGDEKVQLILQQQLKSLLMIRRMQQSTDRVIPFKPLALLCKKISSEHFTSSMHFSCNWSPLAVNLIGHALESRALRLLRVNLNGDFVDTDSKGLVIQRKEGQYFCRSLKEHSAGHW